MLLAPLASRCFAQAIPPPQPNMPNVRIFQTAPLPQAKTPAEYQAYVKAVEIGDIAESEKAAEQFARDYPDSELRYLLFSRLMKMDQEANRAEGVLKNGRKVLSLRPNDPVALVMTSTVLAAYTQENDPEKNARYAEATENASRAINNIDTGLILPPHTPQKNVQEAKDSLLSAAHASIGLVEFARGHDAEAEKELQASLDAGKADPDPLIWMQLGLVQAHQKEYAAALDSFNQALRFADGDAGVRIRAKQERDRLLQLTGGKDTSSEQAQAPQ